MSYRSLKRYPAAVAVAVVAAALLSTSALGFICGDVNNDNQGPNVVDLTYFAQALFIPGGVLPLPQAADVNADGNINIADVTQLVAFLFNGGTLNCLDYLSHTTAGGECAYMDGQNPPLITEHDNYSSGCLEDGNDAEEQVFCQLVGGDLHVYHLGAFYQCCLEYYTTIDIDGSDITVIEGDSGEYCDCMCTFDLETVIYDMFIMTPDTLIVTVIGIEGDTVGTDSVFIGGEEYIDLQVQGDDVYINHVNAYYQCCLGYSIDFLLEDGTITARESDTGMLCDCYCYFNLQSVIEDLTPGDYNLVFIGIEGDTLDFIQFVIEPTARLSSFEHTGCVDWTRGSVTYTVDGNSLLMDHFDAYYNCGAVFLVEFEHAPDTLRIYEWNVSEDWLYCMCYFNISATIDGLVAGTYVVEVYGRDYPTDPVELLDRQTVLIP